MSIMRSRLILLAAALLIGVCGGSVLHATQEGGTPVPITPLRKPCPTCTQRDSFEVNSGIDDRQRLVIRDQEAWRDVWKRIYSLTAPTPPLPEIDFARELVVVAALGERSSGGHGIIIAGAYDKDDRIEVQVRSVSPGKNCFTTQALIAPVDIVRLPKTDHCVVFHETEVVHECN